MVFASPLLERVARPIRRSWQLNRHRLRFAVLLANVAGIVACSGPSADSLRTHILRRNILRNGGFIEATGDFALRESPKPGEYLIRAQNGSVDGRYRTLTNGDEMVVSFRTVDVIPFENAWVKDANSSCARDLANGAVSAVGHVEIDATATPSSRNAYRYTSEWFCYHGRLGKDKTGGWHCDPYGSSQAAELWAFSKRKRENSSG